MVLGFNSYYIIALIKAGETHQPGVGDLFNICRKRKNK